MESNINNVVPLSAPSKRRWFLSIPTIFIWYCAGGNFLGQQQAPWAAFFILLFPLLLAMLFLQWRPNSNWRSFRFSINLASVVGLVLGLMISVNALAEKEERAMREGDKILDAVAAFLLAEGRYPRNLINLVPEYLESIPVACMRKWATDEEFLYWPSADSRLGAIQFQLRGREKWSRSLLQPWATEGTYNWAQLAVDAPPIEMHYALTTSGKP